MKLVFWVFAEMDPFPWSAPRVMRSGITYDVKAAKKKALRRRFELSEGLPKKPYNEPIKLFMLFGMPIPKSWSKKKKKEALEGKLIPTSRPDLSNCVKAAEDCLKGSYIVDDSFVYQIEATKKYTQTGTIQVWGYTLEEEEL